MKAVLVVAGFGTRMLPITKTIPKEMLPVGNKPVIQYVVEGCVNAGIQDIIMIVSQQKKALEDYFDKNYELEDILQKKGKQDLLDLINTPKNMAHYTFVKQTQMLGTAHAILQIEPWIDEDYFMVIFGDAIYPDYMYTELLKKFAENPQPMICAHEVPKEDTYRYGVLKLDGDKIIEIVEQPKVEDAPSNLVCNGVYILPKSIFPLLKTLPIDASRGEYLLPDGLNILMKQMNVLVCKTDPFRDIGSIDLWMKANNKMYQDGYLFPPL
ncbi:MAG: sugar phosphate nucleotidyltransferase [Candidatus Absconditabacterales bacterium]